MSGERPHVRDDGAPRPPRDDTPRPLRWALRAYPPSVRATEGDLLTSLARDILDQGGSSVGREALGLVRGGLAVRAGALAHAPWEPALRRAGLWIAGALLAIVSGAAWWWVREPAWPGWSWVAVLIAPALVVAGHLTGRRAPVACGALALLVLGFAQANGLLQTVRLQGLVEWGIEEGGWAAGARASFDLPLLACAIPGAVLVLASAAHPRAPVPRATAVTAVAWLLAATAGVALAVDRISTNLPASAVTLGGVRLDGLALGMAAAVVAALGASALGFARRRRDPAGMLAGVLVAAAILPVVCLYGLSSAPLSDGRAFGGFVAAVVAMAVGFVAIVRRIATEPSRA